ncbi:hypothetical protein FHW68_001525 [Pseudomonas sp. Tn43]|uniref:hypothetical protein n=1 Tax=Pseudomonas sp. Tn43 TaxID=701213 RepID=UPI00161217FE|nr:hypothetical protein [Pseudomonas sp. Tn43]MBB3240034.1 hypothetical protein [Pseudomonas sp. Tn43]
MATPKKKQGKTSDQHGTTQVKGTLAQDYVTVVGASYISLVANIRGQRGNMMNFINQGIRQLKSYPPSTQSYSIQRAFFIFKDEYDPKLLAEVKKIVTERYGAEYREYDSISQLVDFVATRKRRGREIKQMDFFSHGVVGSIELGYELDKRDSYRLRDAQARMFTPDAFAYGAKIYSYACRTGLGINADLKVGENENPHYELSLAQVMADATGAAVWAFPRRSLYDQTYGTDEERATVEKAPAKLEADKAASRAYRKKLSDYQRRLSAYRAAQKDANAQLSNETAPAVPVKTLSERDAALLKQAQGRERYKDTLGYPLDAEGAIHGVRSGNTPDGVPKKLCEYKPAK